MSIFHSLAYLDFGTGSVIVQAIVGAVAGVALFGRRAITAIKQKLGLIKLDEDDEVEVPKKNDEVAPKASSTAKKSKKTKAKKSTKKAQRK